MKVVEAEAQRRKLADLHEHCLVCGPLSEAGLHVRFRGHAPGEVRAEWQPDGRWRSYDGTLHGGIVASLLDAAMVHALFSLGHRAVTASLELRFRQGVRLDFPVEIEARRVGAGHGLHRMEATLSQGGEACVRAEARFMETATIDSESP